MNQMYVCNVIVSKEIFKKGLYILHFNINSVIPKINNIQYFAKQSNPSMFGICESKQDSSILNSELNMEN